jgi:hypothetical protein
MRAVIGVRRSGPIRPRRATMRAVIGVRRSGPVEY